MDSNSGLELAVVLLVTVVAGLGGGWFGFILAKLRDDRLRTAEFAMEIASSSFTKMRLHFRDKLNEQGCDVTEYADMKNLRHKSLRNDITAVLNFYEIVCSLREERVLDGRLFDKHIKPLIKHDYELTDSYWRAVEIYQLHNNGELRRPFFPAISRVVGRG